MSSKCVTADVDLLVDNVSKCRLGNLYTKQIDQSRCEESMDKLVEIEFVLPFHSSLLVYSLLV